MPLRMWPREGRKDGGHRRERDHGPVAEVDALAGVVVLYGQKVTVAAPEAVGPDAAVCLAMKVTVDIDTEVAAEVAAEMATEVAMGAADVEATAAMARGRDGGGGREVGVG